MYGGTQTCSRLKQSCARREYVFWGRESGGAGLGGRVMRFSWNSVHIHSVAHTFLLARMRLVALTHETLALFASSGAKLCEAVFGDEKCVSAQNP